MADDRLYGQKVYDGGIAADELGGSTPGLPVSKKSVTTRCCGPLTIARSQLPPRAAAMNGTDLK